jgi:S-DNA-T family DNA segregation ATPase FtsK/SpoIIIE
MLRRVSNVATQRRGKTEAKDTAALQNDLIAVGLATFGALVLAALLSYVWDSGGVLSSAIARALFQTLGIGAYGVPVVSFILAVVYSIDRDPIAAPRLLSGLGLLFVTILITLHLVVPEESIFEPDMLETHGGYVGGLGAWALRVVLGPLPSYVLLVGAAAIALVLLTRLRLAQMFESTTDAARTGLKAARRSVRTVVSRNGNGSAAESGKTRTRARRERSGPGVDLDEPGERRRADAQAPPAPDPHCKFPDLAEFTALQSADPEPDEEPHLQPSRPAVEELETRSGPAKPKTSVDIPMTSTHTSMLTDAMRFKVPPPSVLTEFPEEAETEKQRDEARERQMVLEDTLRSFGIQATVTKYLRGPVITRYEVELERGVRVNQVTRLADNIAMALAATDVRMEAPIPGKSAIGIEVPNKEQSIVGLQGIVASQEFISHPSSLAIALGRDISGRPVVADLVDMPHLLVAGATNSGKSVCLHTIILSFLMRAKPHEVRFIMVDPKRVELSRYDGIPHLMAPVVHSVSAACDVMKKAIREMEKRYDQLAKVSAATIDEYNFFTAGARAVADESTITEAFLEKKLGIDDRRARRLMDMLEYGEVIEQPDTIGGPSKVIINREDERCLPMPRVVIVVDELADLMMQARVEFEFSICRIAQLARATGIHLVIATQRPSVKILTGNIKANIPSRVALAVASQVDSRVILDGPGADRLIGRGDMLFAPLDAPKPHRLQGSFVAREDIERVAEFYREQGEPTFTIIPQEAPEGDEEDSGADLDVSDDLYAAAVRYVVAEQQASVSMLQRRFNIGYARAGRLIDSMEQRGVVGPHEGPKPRIVLIAPGFATAASDGDIFDDGVPRGFEKDFSDDEIEPADDHSPEAGEETA